MKIPHGVTFYANRRHYGEGDDLPPNAPEAIKKLCAEKAAELAKKDKAPEKSAPPAAHPQGEGK